MSRCNTSRKHSDAEHVSLYKEAGGRSLAIGGRKAVEPGPGKGGSQAGTIGGRAGGRKGPGQHTGPKLGRIPAFCQIDPEKNGTPHNGTFCGHFILVWKVDIN